MSSNEPMSQADIPRPKPMRRKGLIAFLIIVGILGVGALYLRNARANAAERLIGAWEGEGQGRTPISMNLPAGDAPANEITLSLNLSARAQFNRDGTLTYSVRASTEGFNFSMTIPDPNKPGDKATWQITQGDRNRLTLRINGPPEIDYDLAFDGPDSFRMTPADQSKGSGTILFRRVKNGG